MESTTDRPGMLEICNSFFTQINEASSKILLGKSETTYLSILTLLAKGHLLIEDVPGVGKTTLAKGLSKLFEGEYRRIQFTPDLLPSDITGISIYDQKNGEFRYQEGPVFCDVLLADEINRGSPRTQSALLQVMEERIVSIEGKSKEVSEDFVVIATQNPRDLIGTFPLPEAQLDRFLMRVSIGYPEFESEVNLISHPNREQDSVPILGKSRLREMRKIASQVQVSAEVSEYVIKIVQATRTTSLLKLGASPRSAIGLLNVAKFHALSAGRFYVTPGDIKYLAPYVLSHRVQSENTRFGYSDTNLVVMDLIDSIPVPPNNFEK